MNLDAALLHWKIELNFGIEAEYDIPICIMILRANLVSFQYLEVQSDELFISDHGYDLEHQIIISQAFSAFKKVVHLGFLVIKYAKEKMTVRIFRLKILTY